MQDPQQPNYAAPGGVPGPGEPFNGAVSPDDLSRPLYGASFGQAVRRFFKNYVNFKGRASRSEYWWVALFIFLLQLIPSILYMVGFARGMSDIAGAMTYDADGNVMLTEAPSAGGGVTLVIGTILMILIGLAVLLPSLGLAWRRLHDGNFAGPLYFLGLIPYVGGIAVLVLMLMPPKPAGRRFDLA